MTTFTDSIQGCKTSPTRTIWWTPHPAEAGCPCEGILEVESKQGTTAYRVTEFWTSWDGRAFTLDKEEGETYFAFVAANGTDHRCDCPGHTYGHGQPCRHLLALRVVLANGWLPHPGLNGERDVGNAEPDDRSEPEPGSDPLDQGSSV